MFDGQRVFLVVSQTLPLSSFAKWVSRTYPKGCELCRKVKNKNALNPCCAWLPLYSFDADSKKLVKPLFGCKTFQVKRWRRCHTQLLSLFDGRFVGMPGARLENGTLGEWCVCMCLCACVCELCWILRARLKTSCRQLLYSPPSCGFSILWTIQKGKNLWGFWPF